MKRLYKIIFCQRLSGNLQVQFNQLIHKSFFLDFTEAKLEENKDKFCSQKNQIGYLLALKNQKIIGILVLLKRRLIFNHQKLILGGFGGLCVVEAKRKQGIATALLKKGVARLKREGCDIAYLCTYIEKLGNLYKPFDFVALNRQHAYLGKSGKRYIEDDAMVAPINSREKFQAVLSEKKIFNIGRGNW